MHARMRSPSSFAGIRIVTRGAGVGSGGGARTTNSIRSRPLIIPRRKKNHVTGPSRTYSQKIRHYQARADTLVANLNDVRREGKNRGPSDRVPLPFQLRHFGRSRNLLVQFVVAEDLVL